MGRQRLVGRTFSYLLTATMIIGGGGAMARTPVFAMGASSPSPHAAGAGAGHGAARGGPKAGFKGASILPLSFEPNRGQADSQVRFVSHGDGYTLFLTATGATLAIAPPRGRLDGRGTHILPANAPRHVEESVVRLNLVGAAPNPRITGVSMLPGKVNYFIGDDRSRWRTNIPTYAQVKYAQVYRGVDMIYHGVQGRLAYDFVLQPGVSPRVINMQVAGAQKLLVDRRGNLVVQRGGVQLLQDVPLIYQPAGNQNRIVTGRFTLVGPDRVSFAVGAHDPRKPLVIDPVLRYSSYLGGSSDDGGRAIAVDSGQNIYVTGYTASTTFPKVNALQPTIGGSYDAFVTKINPFGTAIVYSTYLGGNSTDGGDGIAVDSSGNAYVTGYTYSTNFPTVGALQPSFGGNEDAFIAKINATGNGLLYSTYLGGASPDVGNAIALGPGGAMYVTGNTLSTNFPVVNGYRRSYMGGTVGDAFIAKLSPAGNALVFSTYWGGSQSDLGRSIAVDGQGNAYVCGDTMSTDFSTVNAFQPTYGGDDGVGGPYDTDGDGWVAKLNATGSPIYSTYLGGDEDDVAFGVAADAQGDAYVTGQTASPTTFPLSHPLQPTFGGGDDAFITEFNPTGSALVYSTFLGGNDTDAGLSIAVDSYGLAYVAGYAYSTNFPTVSPLQATHAGSSYNTDAIVAKISPNGSGIQYSTYMGGSGDDFAWGIAVDHYQNAYVTGTTSSPDFPTKSPLQSTYQGPHDAFVLKIQS